MTARVLLDTDILSLLRRGHKRVTQYATDYIVTYGCLTFTELTWYEVVRGYRAIGAHRQLEIFEAFCRHCDIFSLDHNSLDCAATIYADLRQRGELIGEVDILIAGIAVAHGMGVATRNVGHFSRIAGFRVENWAV